MLTSIPHGPWRRTAIVGVGAAALLASVPAAAGASARPAPARLRITAVSAPPAQLTPGDAFTVTGKVRNTGGRGTGRVRLAVELRTGAHPRVVYAVGAAAVKNVAPGRTRSFRVRAVLRGTVSDAARRSFTLVARARPAHGTAVTRKAARRTVVVPKAVPVTPAPAPKPAPGAPVDTTRYTPGARTLHDTLFPTIGNGGYDAQHYDLDLTYTVGTKFLRGTSTMTAKATQDLSELSLDLTAINDVSRVTVDGVQASFAQDAEHSKLVVVPAHGIRNGTAFTVAVTYAGVQQAYVDPDGSEEGFVPDPARGAVVVSEPVGSMGWFPNNDVPTDKATYRTRITVPADFQALGTGVFVRREQGADTATYVWDDPDPTASYLYSFAIGRYDLNTKDLAQPVMTQPAAGSLNTPIPFYTAIDSDFSSDPLVAGDPTSSPKAQLTTKLNTTPSILDYYADYYGVKYPFASAGGVVPLQAVGYSLETQGRPIYATTTDPSSPGVGISTVAHENGHMYFGDGVTLSQWKDIWLNEGMTEFSSWLWQANRMDGGTSLASRWATYYTNSTSKTFWNLPPAAPREAADIFNSAAMYRRGATTMLAIHDILGEARFRAMMHTWLTDHMYGNVTTEQFIALVKATDPGRAARWTEFFRQWLYTSYSGDPAQPGNKPSVTPQNFDAFAVPAS
ncbi:M1 family metallopeptidase [Patulibacter sp. SYSU D01012]|uniref:M1 family metallopeptidase n=1 Tax=Patulibacter sp. SYSU D01012 TaxID=2817381 RepID=UPI001B315D3E|nr:M1 family metallopeptidase [Patulibacter sp. SYSU D01012]